jgi:hypothetical protein
LSPGGARGFDMPTKGWAVFNWRTWAYISGASPGP